MVVGAGALGSELCQQLALARVRRVTVVDPDALEARNAILSPLFRAALKQSGTTAIGQPKAKIIVDFLHSSFPELTWDVRCVEIADVGFEEMKNFDAILSCPDSTLARLETARAARVLRIPMIDAGVMPNNVAEGRVSVFAASLDAACYLCGIGEARRAELLAYASSLSLSCTVALSSGLMTGTQSAVRLIASKVLEQLIRIQTTSFSEGLATHESYTDRFRLETSQNIDELGSLNLLSAERHRLTRSPGCPWHDLDPPGELLSLQPGQTFAEALREHPRAAQNLVLEFPWPICLQSRCLACDRTEMPFQRVALVRRKGSCFSCGISGRMEPIESLSALRLGDAAAGKTPQQLGLPERHLYKLRRSIMYKGVGGSE
jgi:molybdopterin/thiamine biosynthesis adenylyltransferase